MHKFFYLLKMLSPNAVDNTIPDEILLSHQKILSVKHIFLFPKLPHSHSFKAQLSIVIHFFSGACYCILIYDTDLFSVPKDTSYCLKHQAIAVSNYP